MKPSEPSPGRGVAPALISLPARLENLPRFLEPVLAAAQAAGVAPERCRDLELALEESLVNIFNYAYPDDAGRVQVIAGSEEKHFLVRLEDDGIAFDMEAAAAPDLSADLTTRRIGGLGIHLTRSLMDEVRYRRAENRNILELVVNLPPGKATS